MVGTKVVLSLVKNASKPPKYPEKFRHVFESFAKFSKDFQCMNTSTPIWRSHKFTHFVTGFLPFRPGLNGLAQQLAASAAQKAAIDLTGAQRRWSVAERHSGRAAMLQVGQ